MRWRQPLTVVYTVAAGGLVPWAVALWWLQSRTGLTHHAELLTSTLLGTLYVAALTSVGAAPARPRGATIAASIGVTVAITATCFHLATAGSRLGGAQGGVALGSLVVVIAASGWLVNALTRRSATHYRLRLVRWAVVTALAVLVAPAVALVGMTPALVPVSHLRFAWVGLDTIEVVGLTATAWCAWRRTWWGVIAGSATAALLFTDATVNVLATAGSAQTQAIAMTAFELPLAAGGIAVALLVPRRADRN